ncbi:hypothetical protein ACN24M_11220 [Streptomyces microflavus]
MRTRIATLAVTAVAAVGAAAHIWSPLYICNPYAAKPGVYELWVRY